MDNHDNQEYQDRLRQLHQQMRDGKEAEIVQKYLAEYLTVRRVQLYNQFIRCDPDKLLECQVTLREFENFSKAIQQDIACGETAKDEAEMLEQEFQSRGEVG